MATKKKGARRNLIKGKEKSYVQRDRWGRFKKWISRKRAAKADRRTKAKTIVKQGYGGRGDLKKRK